MGKYKCPHAIRRPRRVPIDCEIIERDSAQHKYMPCAFQRYCPKEGKSILTPGSVGCLRRLDGKKREEPKKNENGYLKF